MTLEKHLKIALVDKFITIWIRHIQIYSIFTLDKITKMTKQNE
jgi:hypothetical protein